MKSVSISDVRHRLLVLIEGVVQTKEPIAVTRYGSPTAMIVPVSAHVAAKNRYPLRGHPISLADDFDEPMTGMWSALRVAVRTQ